ncbi:17446_t:CDS:10 [Acaulospora morrowiae]|uniref:17446_t:CDS:1 n=1 Tax=Acaulospora morrowiae TaxID=94023 RepID=A0A9N8VBY2_9GLOM|nr:17446_t:CDS:10 [Acaulospora morrowiae]
MGNEQTKGSSYNEVSPTSHAKYKPLKGIFRKGIQYNMKIIIRGDIRTGKSTLFERLQGNDFVEEYTPTPQIQVANIQWSYNQTEDVIKVEIWDVVDKEIISSDTHKKSNVSDGRLKIDNSQATSTSPQHSISQIPPDQLTLDAATINVYRNTHGVILMFDMTKSWTFDYAIKELKEIPNNIAVATEHPSANIIRYVETSMSNGLGLDYIHKYFGVPFLQLQRDILQQQFNFKTKELSKLLSALDVNDDVFNSTEQEKTHASAAVDMEKDQLEMEKMQLKEVWDKEFNDLSEGKESGHEESNPTSSSTIPQHPKITTPDIGIIENFDAGELEDDFFNDTPDHAPELPEVVTSKLDEAEEVVDSSNPMVAADEDLVGIDQQADGDEEQPNNTVGVVSVQDFNRDLNVWGHRHHSSFTSTGGISDSSDEDLVPTAKRVNYLDESSTPADDLKVIGGDSGSYSNFEHQENEKTLDTSGYVPITFGTPTGYEEISEGQDNPWLEGGDAPQKGDSQFVAQTKAEFQNYEMFDGQDEGASKSVADNITESITYHRQLHLHHPHSFSENGGTISSLSWSGNGENSGNDQYITNETESATVIEGAENLKKKKTKESTTTKEDNGDNISKDSENIESSDQKVKEKKSKGAETAGNSGTVNVENESPTKSSSKKSKSAKKKKLKKNKN